MVSRPARGANSAASSPIPRCTPAAKSPAVFAPEAIRFSTCSSFIAVGPGPRKCYIHAQCKWRTPLCSRMTLTSSSEADCISPRASFSNESTLAAAPQFPRVFAADAAEIGQQRSLRRSMMVLFRSAKVPSGKLALGTGDSFPIAVPKKSKYRVDAGNLQNLISYIQRTKAHGSQRSRHSRYGADPGNEQPHFKSKKARGVTQ